MISTKYKKPGEVWTDYSFSQASDEYIVICITSTGRLIGTKAYKGLYYSDDNGNTWASVNGVSSISLILTVVSIPGTQRLIAGTENRLMFSEDNGTTWNGYSNSEHKYVASICVTNNKIFICNTYRNQVYWTNIPSMFSNCEWTMLSIPSNITPFAICVTATGRTIIGKRSGGIYYSDDLINWTQGSNLGSTQSLLNTSYGRLFMCTTAKVYYSDDDGETWVESRGLLTNPDFIYSNSNDKIMIRSGSPKVYYITMSAVDTREYISKPLTGKQAKILVQECKAYVQAKKAEQQNNG